MFEQEYRKLWNSPQYHDFLYKAFYGYRGSPGDKLRTQEFQHMILIICMALGAMIVSNSSHHCYY